eukprot:GGOE01002597.1.p1 GENE.GGOE01002597.1~~GGOE01002597.1.p1  ORF type:complete len:416 (-),score=76.95 GGOE01002597.1:97-1344(-)
MELKGKHEHPDAGEDDKDNELETEGSDAQSREVERERFKQLHNQALRENATGWWDEKVLDNGEWIELNDSPLPFHFDLGKRAMWIDNQEKYTKAWASGYGQHNNHLVALMNALVISKAIGRTLIIPDFIFMHRKDGQPSTIHNKHKYTKRMYERRYLHPTVLYNFTGYWSKYCFVFRDDFFRHNKLPQAANCYKPRKKTIRMFDAICEVVVHIKRQQGHEMVPLALNDTHPLLYFPELYWYLPTNWSRDFAPLQPSAAIRQAVDRFKAEELNNEPYTAVHVRNLEGSCKRMMASLLWAINGTAQQRWAALQQCDMNLPYITAAQAGHGKQRIFLATDGQIPEIDRRLMAHGAVQFKSDIYAHHSLFFMAADFWLMCEADVFCPNILSSVDWNVCAIRMGRGRSCFNFFTDPHVTP